MMNGIRAWPNGRTEEHEERVVYKRTKTDSPLKCPYCGKQFNAGRLRDKRNGVTECRECGRAFYYHNITAKYARDHGIRATYKIEEACKYEVDSE